MVAELVDAPENMDIPSRFYVAFIEGSGTVEVVALDESGEVLQSKTYEPRED